MARRWWHWWGSVLAVLLAAPAVQAEDKPKPPTPAPVTDKPATPPAKKAQPPLPDADFLEFLASWDSEDEDWVEFLAAQTEEVRQAKAKKVENK